MVARPAIPGAAPTTADDHARLVAALEQVRAELADALAQCVQLRDSNALLQCQIAQLAAELAEREDLRRRALQAQKMEAIGELTGGIAHDFNNLLTVVSGGLHLLPAAAADPERQQRLIRRMEGAVGRGAEVTRRLLAFARRQLLQPECIDLGSRAETLRVLLAHRLGERVTLHVRLADGLWPVRADPAALELSLLNIAENARDAIPAQGCFILAGANVTLGSEEAAAVGVAVGEYVEIACTDTGRGMPPEVLVRVFEPFFTTKPVGQGTGLGLPQVHGFASQSGGTARVESGVDAGTSVVLLLPRAAACLAEAPPA